MENQDYNVLTDNELLRKLKAPNVFIYQQITDEYGGAVYEVRVGGGFDEKDLPAFKIPFHTQEGDFVMVKYPSQKVRTSLSTNPIPNPREVKQAEMAL